MASISEAFPVGSLVGVITPQDRWFNDYTSRPHKGDVGFVSAVSEEFAYVKFVHIPQPSDEDFGSPSGEGWPFMGYELKIMTDNPE